MGMVMGGVGCFLAILAFHPSFRSVFTDGKEIHENVGKFTNPLLACESGQNLTSNLKIHKKNIENLIAEEKAAGHITTMSVYFRDLNNGPWIGIDEDAPYTPASLAKVPVMITYLYQAENMPTLLDEKIPYEHELQNITPFYPPREELELGKEYTVRELIERTIVYSDNISVTLLTQHLGADKKPLQETYKQLGVDFTLDTHDTLSVRNYASFFRILYNASYLSQKNSEAALQLLAQADFKDGLVAGVPSGVKVAHKFGESWSNPAEDKQLHDCGIVYATDHPYLLCVMTRGKDFPTLANTIAKTSRLVYENVTSPTPN